MSKQNSDESISKKLEFKGLSEKYEFIVNKEMGEVCISVCSGEVQERLKTAVFPELGIALYLLYLYEGFWSDKGMTAMADIVKGAMGFAAGEYRKGTYGAGGTNGCDLFRGLSCGPG